jgi:hypothetical protein
MTLPASGPISISMINTEFGRTSTSLISTNNAYAGTYGAINRNTDAGYNIYNKYANADFPYYMSDWYGYQHVGAGTYVDYTINNFTPVQMQVFIWYVNPQALVTGFVDPYDSITGAGQVVSTNGLLQISYITDDPISPSYPAPVTVTVTDPNTGATLYSNSSLTVPVGTTSLATISSIQRFTLVITITEP